MSDKQVKKSDLVAVKFKRHHSRYNPGETAGFTKDYAEKLLKAGVAEKA